MTTTTESVQLVGLLQVAIASGFAYLALKPERYIEQVRAIVEELNAFIIKTISDPDHINQQRQNLKQVSEAEKNGFGLNKYFYKLFNEKRYNYLLDTLVVSFATLILVFMLVIATLYPKCNNQIFFYSSIFLSLVTMFSIIVLVEKGRDYARKAREFSNTRKVELSPPTEDIEVEVQLKQLEEKVRQLYEKLKEKARQANEKK